MTLACPHWNGFGPLQPPLSLSIVSSIIYYTDSVAPTAETEVLMTWFDVKATQGAKPQELAVPSRDLSAPHMADQGPRFSHSKCEKSLIGQVP